MMDETRGAERQLDELDQTAAALDEQLRLALARVPNLTRDEVPAGTSEADNVTVKTWGEKPSFDFEPKPHWEMGEAAGDSRPGTRGQAERGAVCGLHGRGGAAGAGADRLHARPAHAEARLHRGAAAVHGEFRSRCSAPASCPSLPKTCFAARMRMLRRSRAASSRTTITG